jgi:hypothetical protein
MDDTGPLSVMLQAGYLTVGAKSGPGSPSLSLGYPNLEVRASLSHLLTRDSVGSLEERETPGRLERNVKSMMKSLFSRDADGMAKAFKSILCDMPIHYEMTDDGNCNMIFRVQVVMARYQFQKEEPDGWGMDALSFISPDGNKFIVKVRHSGLPGKTGGVLKAGGYAKPDKDRLLREILDRIKVRKCLRTFRGDGFRVWKTAVSVSGKIDVAVAFEEYFDR